MLQVIEDIAKALGAIGVIGGVAIFLYAKLEKILVWLLQRIYGHSGGLRIVRASRTGIWKRSDEKTATLSCRWHATALLNRPIQILTVHMTRPIRDLDGGLRQNDEVQAEHKTLLNAVYILPDFTATFDALFSIPISDTKEDRDIEGEIIFTDSFNNPHRKKVRFKHRRE